MLFIFTVAYIKAGRVSVDDVPKLITAYTITDDVAIALGYASRTEGVEYLSQSIAEYQKMRIADWHVKLMRCLVPTPIPDKKLFGRIVLGSVLLINNVNYMIVNLKNNP